MSYHIQEISVQDGAPIEVYTFTRGGVGIGWFTSAESEVWVGSELYQTWPGGLARGRLEIAGDEGRSNLEIVVAADFPIAELIHLRPRTGVVGVTLRRFHRADASDIKPIWAGRVLGARRDRTGGRKLVCEPRSVTQARIGLHRICQPGCNLQLYGPQCRLTMGDWGHATTVSAISGTTLTVASVGIGMPYAGGMVAFTDSNGITDYAFIEEASGTTLSLDLALYGLAVSDAVTLYPGCDWTMATCDGVFDNAVNYGGRLNVPDRNPVTQSAFA